MYLRTILILFVLGALALFTVVNWHAFTTPTTLSLVFATIEGPLGLILLGVVALLTALFLIYVTYLQSSVLMETRRHARELHAQRELAEDAEISRIHELRAALESQIQALTQRAERSQIELAAQSAQLKNDLRQSIEMSHNALAASLAEIDDRIQHSTLLEPRKSA